MNDIKDLEKTLWATADKLRSNMDAAEYKHVVLGLIFLKYISDAFNDLHSKLVKGEGEFEGADAEDADEYVAYNVFFVPETARWKYLQDRAKQPEIGKLIDNSMDEIEKINSNLKGVLPKIYADPELNKTRLGELIDLIGTIGFNQEGHAAKDLLGQVYEYFLGQFADAEGKKGGQFYTPSSIVKLLVEMLEPYEGRVYDGACGSGGMFVQSEKFVKEHQGNIKNLSIYGQESNPTTLRLAKMNLAIRGIDAKIELGDTFMADKHKDLKADYILANPPFNISDWSGEQLREDSRWKFGVPPTGNANYAWLQHFISKLSNNGTAGIVLANGSMNSNTGSEGEIRKNMIEAGLIDCMVSLPSQLFYNTMIPACLWFLSKNKTNGKYRNRSNEILFIDARNLGDMVNRRNRELSNEDILKISGIYHNWRNPNGNYQDVAGFCKSAKIDEVKNSNWVLMPGKYVGNDESESDNTTFEQKLIPIYENLNLLNGNLGMQDNDIGNLLLKYYPNFNWRNVKYFPSNILERFLQVLYKEWFVNYRIPNKNFTMKSSELGDIPSDWEVVKLGELCERITKGTTPTTLGSKFIDSGINFIRAECIMDYYKVESNKFQFIDAETHDKLSRSQLQKDDVLITIAGTIGRVGIVTERILPANTNQAIGIIRVNQDLISSNYVYYWLKQEGVRNDLLAGITQSVQANISLTDLNNLKIIIPSSNILFAFNELSKLVHSRLENEIIYSEKLLNSLDGRG